MKFTATAATETFLHDILAETCSCAVAGRFVGCRFCMVYLHVLVTVHFEISKIRVFRVSEFRYILLIFLLLFVVSCAMIVADK